MFVWSPKLDQRLSYSYPSTVTYWHERKVQSILFSIKKKGNLLLLRWKKQRSDLMRLYLRKEETISSSSFLFILKNKNREMF